MSVYKKLHQIQKNRLQVAKTCKANLGGGRVYEYASLDDVLAESIPALNEAGLTLVQSVALVDQTHVIRTEVIDIESGEKVTSDIAMPVVAKWHDFGSGMTYARRYALSAMLGIACDADDDANSAMDSQRSAPEPARKLTFFPVLQKFLGDLKEEGFGLTKDDGLDAIYAYAQKALNAKPGLKTPADKGTHLAELLNLNTDKFMRMIEDAKNEYMSVPGN